MQMTPCFSQPAAASRSSRALVALCSLHELPSIRPARGPTPQLSRRLVSLLTVPLLLAVQPVPTASALDLDNLTDTQKQQLSKALTTPIEFLRARQRAGGGSRLLAPIRASRQRLQAAENLVKQVNIYDPNLTLYRDALSVVRGASLNCYSFDLMEGDTVETVASTIQRNLRIGDACTFRLIAKNVTSLLPANKRSLSAETNQQLNELIMSYQMLDAGLARAWEGDNGSQERIPDLMQFTLSHTTSFETCIEKCLGLPPSALAPSVLNILLPGFSQQAES